MAGSLLATNPAFRCYWGARLASCAGDQIAHTALLIAVFTGRGGGALGLLLLAGTVPRLLGPLLGALADRYHQRRLMIGCDLGQAALYLVLALAGPPLPVLLVLIAAATTLATLFSTAGRSLLPRMVGMANIPAANAQLAVAMNIGVAAGPALGGLLLAGLGLTGTLLVNVATFGLSAGLIALGRSVAEPAPEATAVLNRVKTAKGAVPPVGPTGAAVQQTAAVPKAPPSDDPDESFTQGLRGGLAVVRSNGVVRAVCIGFFASVVFAALDNVAVIPLGLSDLKVDTALVGTLGTVYGLGMIGALLLLTRLLHRYPGLGASRVLYLSLIALGTGTLLTGVSPVLSVALVAQAVAGAGNGWQTVAIDTLIQQHVPQHRLGTVFGTVYTFPYAAAAIAYLAGGPLLDSVGPRWVLVVAGGGALATLLITYPLLNAARKRAAPGTIRPGAPIAAPGP
jgi:predicted MFS family arabinose efflux permease